MLLYLYLLKINFENRILPTDALNYETVKEIQILPATLLSELK